MDTGSDEVEFNGIKVLVVEDEAMIRTSMQMHLPAYGYRVKLAKDGREGLEAYQSKPSDYDVVLMDMNMPNMKGDEAFRAMKEINPDIQCIIMSGYMDDHQALIQDDPSIQVVVKPFRIEEILESIEKATTK